MFHHISSTKHDDSDKILYKWFLIDLPQYRVCFVLYFPRTISINYLVNVNVHIFRKVVAKCHKCVPSNTECREYSPKCIFLKHKK